MSVERSHGTATVGHTELRSRFSARLSGLYGAEVPAYTTLVEVSQEVNVRVLSRHGAAAAAVVAAARAVGAGQMLTL